MRTTRSVIRPLERRPGGASVIERAGAMAVITSVSEMARFSAKPSTSPMAAASPMTAPALRTGATDDRSVQATMFSTERSRTVQAR